MEHFSFFMYWQFSFFFFCFSSGTFDQCLNISSPISSHKGCYCFIFFITNMLEANGRKPRCLEKSGIHLLSTTAICSVLQLGKLSHENDYWINSFTEKLKRLSCVRTSYMFRRSMHMQGASQPFNGCKVILCKYGSDSKLFVSIND